MAHTCKQVTASGGGGGGAGGSGGSNGGGGSNSGGGTDNGGTDSGGTDNGGGGGSAPSGPSFAQLLDDSRTAARDGHYGKALRSCELALGKQPGDQDAIMACVIASCRLKNSAKARRYIRRLNSQTRQQAGRQICLQSGVNDL